MAKYEDFIEIINIDSYKQLIDKIQGSKPNFRENYIFRGLGSIDYELIPSALRKDDNGQYTITKFIDSKFCVYEITSALNHFIQCKIPLDTYNQFKRKLTPIRLNKHGKDIKNDKPALCWISSENELQYKRELYILLKFLNWADKSGLKISTPPKIRRLIHENINLKPYKGKWPNSDFFEIISLAQHHGLPTQAMDWSYDYKASLYFAVINILEGNNDDCVLWAFNYKLFEDSYSPNHPFPYKLQFYRPKYNSNQNLKSQKGLFTFIISEEYNFDRRPLNDIIIEDIMNNIDFKSKIKNYVKIFGLKDFIIPPEEKIFYKFIIPNELKHEILKELYLEGYSEENLFPGYDGVVHAIKNRVKLEDYVTGRNISSKMNMIMSFNDKELESIFKNKKRIIFKKEFNPTKIYNVFIYSKNNNEILGYFNVSEIIKNTPKNMWNTFNRKSILSEEEFNKYFENKTEGYALLINDLVRFDYPIPINFNLKSDFCCIKPDDKNLNFLLNFK